MSKFKFFKKKKRVYLRKYSYICFSLLLLLFIYYRNYKLDGDTWFLLNHGRYVFYHGIPKIEPFTIHSNLSFVMQQWLASLIFFLSYHFLGIKSLFGVCVLLNYLFFYICYKLCMLISENNYKISFIVTIIIDFLLLAFGFIVIRPQLFTFCLIAFLFFCLESYIRKRNVKYLYLLPVISILQVNLHASMWWMLYVFMLPYLLDGFKIRKYKGEYYEKSPIVIAMIVMFFVAFINPYGIDALVYFFNSYGIKEINNFVYEMKAIDFSGFFGMVLFLTVIVAFMSIVIADKKSLRIRYILLMIGSLYLGVSSYKGFSYFCILSYFPIAFYYKDKLKIIKAKEIYSVEYKKIYGELILYLLLIFGVSFSYIGFDYTNGLESGIKFLLQNYKKDEIKLYVGYDDGGYCEYRGIKSYLDPRAEVFLKAKVLWILKMIVKTDN